MNEKNRSYRTRISALALSVALTMAAAIGLTAASEYQAPWRAEAQSQCGVRRLGFTPAECAERRPGTDADRPSKRPPRLKFSLT